MLLAKFEVSAVGKAGELIKKCYSRSCLSKTVSREGAK